MQIVRGILVKMMPVEVNILILNRLDNPTLARLMRTSRKMYYLCCPLLYKHLSISSSFQLALFLQFTQNRDLLLTLDIGSVNCAGDAFPCFHWVDLPRSLDRFKFKSTHFSWPRSAFVEPQLLDSNPKALYFKTFILTAFERFCDSLPLRPNLIAIAPSDFELFQTTFNLFLPILPNSKSRLRFASYVYNSILVGNSNVSPLYGFARLDQTKMQIFTTEKISYHTNANDPTCRKKFMIMTSSLKKIAESCTKIQALVFNNQDLLEDNYIELMRDYESNLVHVNLRDMVKTPCTISDALSRIVKNCKNLQFLDLSWSSWLTMAHLAIILESKSIRILNLIGCSKLPIQIAKLYQFDNSSKMKFRLYQILMVTLERLEYPVH
jgi:hypothetical protein